MASSFDQGLICLRHVLRFLKPSMDQYPKQFRVQDSVNRASVTDRETCAMLRVVESDPRCLHGAAPLLLLYDELAQRPPREWPRLRRAILSATDGGVSPDTGHLGRDFQANSSNIPTPSRTRYQGHFEPHIKATWSQLSQAISNHISPDTPTPRRPIPTAKPLLNPNKTGTKPRTSPTPRTGPPGRSPYHPLTTRQPRQSGTRTPPAPGPNPTGTQPNAGLIPGQKPASRTPGRNTAKQPEYPVAKRHPDVISLQRTM